MRDLLGRSRAAHVTGSRSIVEIFRNLPSRALLEVAFCGQHRSSTRCARLPDRHDLLLVEKTQQLRCTSIAVRRSRRYIVPPAAVRTEAGLIERAGECAPMNELAVGRCARSSCSCRQEGPVLGDAIRRESRAPELLCSRFSPVIKQP